MEIDAGTVVHAQETYRIDTLRFIKGSAVDLPLEDACVDLVVSFETLEHIRQHDQFMREVKRVLRPDGRFIVSTPDRSVYSARLESFNQFHLLELTEPEFETLLRMHFAQVVILRQRAILGSLIASTQNERLWRTYERRAPEYIEASNGLARSPYLIGIASDCDLPYVASSAYIDRRGVGETVDAFLRAPTLEALAVERERERDAVRAAHAQAEDERDAALAALTDAKSRAAECERERDAVRAAHAQAEDERDAALAALTDVKSRAAECERDRDTALAALIDAKSRAAERDAVLAALATEEARVRELTSYRGSWLKRLRITTRPYRRAVFPGSHRGSADLRREEF